MPANGLCGVVTSPQPGKALVALAQRLFLVLKQQPLNGGFEVRSGVCVTAAYLGWERHKAAQIPQKGNL